MKNLNIVMEKSLSFMLLVNDHKLFYESSGIPVRLIVFFHNGGSKDFLGESIEDVAKQAAEYLASREEIKND